MYVNELSMTCVMCNLKHTKAFLTSILYTKLRDLFIKYAQVICMQFDSHQMN